MIIELGHFALVLALFVALLPLATALAGVRLAAGLVIAVQAAVSAFWLVTVALFALVHAYALSDFSVLNVAANSNTMKPLVYKLTAVWGNHEGSMLLWLWMMTGWGALYARRAVDRALLPATLAVQGALTAGFALFILLTSNPFQRLDPAAPEGLDLNPVLQDPLLVIHPPFLYLGVTGFALVFALALAGLITRRTDAGVATALRAWTLPSWAALTAGIALGSFWAYYELGWGGFWFWDPVENISLLPWLAGVALLHSLRALERRGSLPGWTLLLALLPFIFAILGTFLVRSGLLTSVHAFAADPSRGVFLLALTAAAAGGALAVFAFRAPQLAPGAPFGWLSRDTAVLANNVFMSVALTTVALGTLYPLVLAALDAEAVSVGTPYYVAVLVPLLVPLAMVMGLAPFLAWRQTPVAMLQRLLRLPIVLTALIMTLVALSDLPLNALVWAGMGSAAWIMAATLSDILAKTDNLRRWRNLTRPQAAMTVAHLGFALLIMGATAATQWGQEETLWMKPGDRVHFGGNTVLLLGVETGLGSNYNADRGIFAVAPRHNPPAMYFMTPERRLYPVQDKTTSESALRMTGLGMLSVVLGDVDAKDSRRWVVRLYHHPLIVLIFAGAVLMALGALIALPSRGERGAGGA